MRGLGGHREMAGTSQTTGRKDSEAAAPLRCGAHEVPGTSVNAGVVSIANLSESSSSSCEVLPKLSFRHVIKVPVILRTTPHQRKY